MLCTSCAVHSELDGEEDLSSLVFLDAGLHSMFSLMDGTFAGFLDDSLKSVPCTPAHFKNVFNLKCVLPLHAELGVLIAFVSAVPLVSICLNVSRFSCNTVLLFCGGVSHRWWS